MAAGAGKPAKYKGLTRPSGFRAEQEPRSARADSHSACRDWRLDRPELTPHSGQAEARTNGSILCHCACCSHRSRGFFVTRLGLLASGLRDLNVIDANGSTANTMNQRSASAQSVNEFHWCTLRKSHCGCSDESRFGPLETIT